MPPGDDYLENMMPMNRWSLFLIFATLNVLGGLLNHIDDTDEPYGYWEPLHYLLYGHGLQTWEYAPQYAIRSYSFLLPIYWLVQVFQLICGNNREQKIIWFYIVRLLLGVSSAYAESSFLYSLTKRLQWSSFKSKAIQGLAIGLMTCAPGLLLSSTAFLPSALAGTFFMLSLSCWLDDSFLWSIFWGGIAVLWTGWPFVGLLFLPIGLHMLWSCYQTSSTSTTHKHYNSGIIKVITFCLSSLVLVIIVFIPTILIDHYYYQTWTVPSLNILLYNALAGNGDELYGVEPLSYYLMNLLLTCQLAWPLFCMFPIGCLSLVKKESSSNKIILLTLYASVVLWLGVLFSRPHKEERFLYPIYGPLCLLAAYSGWGLLTLADELLVKVTASGGGTPSVDKESSGCFRTHFYRLLLVASVILGSCRLAANHQNYFGYISIFQQAQHHLQGPGSLCIGAEWHRFPSHFFLQDSSVRLNYVRDRFGGLLPQAFGNHTAATPHLHFNNLNQEETDRYVQPSSCDFLLVTIESPDLSTVLHEKICSETLLRWYNKQDHNNLEQSDFHKNVKCATGEPVFEVISYQPVLSYIGSVVVVSNHPIITRLLTVISRAYYLPFISKQYVPRAAYALLKKRLT